MLYVVTRSLAGETYVLRTQHINSVVMSLPGRRTLGLARRLLTRDYHAVANYFGRSAYKLPDLRSLPDFSPLARRIVAEGRSSLYYDRLFTLFASVRETSRRFEGPLTMAEVGVWKGGTSRFLLECVQGSRLLGFDTFEGHDARDIQDKNDGEHAARSFADTSYASVQGYLAGFDVTLYKGRFAETCHAADGELFHFVHLDVDIYQPMKHALEFFSTRVAKGGVIVVDDYGFATCPGVIKAVNEFKDSAINFDFAANMLTGQCRLVRLY
jgi:O-methyltransferase